MRLQLLRQQRRFFASSLSANPSTTLYAESLFRKWTPPHTTSIEEHVREKSCGTLYREDSFGEFLKPVELMRKVESTTQQVEDEETMMTFAGEQVPTWQPKRQLSFATYAGVTDSNLWNEEFQLASTKKPRRVISLDNMWTNKRKSMATTSSVANYNTVAVKDDPWDTPRCTVP